MVKTPTKELDKCIRKKITLLLNRHPDYLKYKILDCRKFIIDFEIECGESGEIETRVIKQKPCPENCTDPSQGTCNTKTGICNCMKGYSGPECVGK